MAEKWIEGKAADLVRDYGATAAVAVFSLLIGIGQWLTSSDTVKLFTDNAVWQDRIKFYGLRTVAFCIFGLFLAAIWSGKGAKRLSAADKKIDQLQAELDSWEQDVGLLTSGLLVGIAEQLHFGTQPPAAERVTIYTFNAPNVDGKPGFFVPFGRYSRNPEYSTKSRLMYPHDSGRIAATWQHGVDFATDYPDPKADPDAYIQRCGIDGIPPDVALGIRMKSRLFFGWRIMDTRGAQPLAVVIVESTSPIRYNETMLRQIFGSQSRTLSEIVERLALPRTGTVRKARM